MFEDLPLLPSDPILGLSVAYREDPNPDKVDLGVGVYRNEAGATPIMAAVAAAEQERLRAETSKAYTFPAGYPGANEVVNELLLGAGHSALRADRVRSIQTPGGCGALRVAAELITRARPKARVWVSTPSWANHVPLLGGAGLTLEEYPYYDYESHSLDFESMLSVLTRVPAGDVVLFHASCHNPSGADLSPEQWRQLTDLALERNFVPLIDSAYQGLGEGLEEDAFGPRLMAERLPEVIVASSFSKNFGLYRERAGALTLVSANTEQALACHSQLLSVTRGLYSMPPAHGSAIVDIILHSPELTRLWSDELAQMRARIQGLRQALVATLANHLPERDFSFIARERGMFSFLGLSEAQVARLRTDYSIYMTANSRINVAGLSDDKMDYVGRAIAQAVSTD
ncbi:amino acid aminotransferase [Marinimicrobium sp. ABcell2]|uniref:amino acid aminotransferase n=1 Tax=Marinimicrobium sp. ABcell2 TaxID=3069751 RepID=UPI0027B42803|nr:amino acid aminotransferase [Marinimicrobium sp. ABcell2]MDQ2077605.1 amino acid aminotransferase [Marinimicrobium sp. ABcell2]